jgi:hypothetical protein
MSVLAKKKNLKTERVRPYRLMQVPQGIFLSHLILRR